MKISTLFYTLRQGIKSIFRNKWFSLASIATIAACLFLFGLFYTIIINLQHIVRTAEEGVSVTVFFEAGTEDTRIAEIGDMIRIRPEVSRIEFVSADEAWEWMQEHYENIREHADGFPTNPLANHMNYVVYLSDVSMQEALVGWLSTVPGISKVRYSNPVASGLTGVNLIIAYVSVAIIGILLAVSVFLISNTVTIGISVRQEEIGIMKYIGATDFFVRAPFVIEGMLIGAIGAGIPLGVIYMLYNRTLEMVVANFPGISQLLRFLSVEEVFRFLLPVAFGIGIGIGFIGSVTTVRKHLRV